MDFLVFYTSLCNITDDRTDNNTYFMVIRDLIFDSITKQIKEKVVVGKSLFATATSCRCERVFVVGVPVHRPSSVKNSFFIVFFMYTFEICTINRMTYGNYNMVTGPIQTFTYCSSTYTSLVSKWSDYNCVNYYHTKTK